MKTSLRISLILLLTTFFQVGYAQAQSISGKVTDFTDQQPLPGVNVVLDGTSTGTVTDIDGNYSLDVPEGGTLVFSFIGYETRREPINSRAVIDLALMADIQQLTELVVTAQGVSREKASLSYSQQTLEGDAVNTVKESNFINSLSGKVAGVNVRTNNTMGGSTNITIRGNSSFTNNQPLFVIDGVPVSNETNNSRNQERGRRGYDYGNPAADINPEDIASMSILKGAAATALYGSRGQNGVILITTKKGKNIKGIGVTFTTGVTVGKVNKNTFVDYQDQYGAGYGPYYGSSGYFEEEDIDGDGILDFIVPTTEDGSYGGNFNPDLMVYHWDSFVPESPNFMQKRPWVAAENSPVDFFETQTTFNNSIALAGGNENTTFRLSYTNLNMEDILPNSEMVKHTINFNGATQLTDKLSADVLFQYNQQDVTGRFSTGYGDNLMSQFRQWWEVNVDVKALEDIYEQTGRNYTWNAGDYADPLTPIFWDNPYWTRYENYNSDTRDRILTKLGINYKFNDWLTFNGSVSIDGYTEIREERRAVGSIATEFGVTAGVDESSGYSRSNIENAEYNYNALLNANKQINDDFNLSGLLGFNLRKESYDFSQASTSGGLAVPDLYSLSNSIGSNPFPFQYLWEKEVYGYFANANIGFRNFLYLDGNYRIDVSSALPVENNQYNYYSVGMGFVVSEIVDFDWLSFGKVRASYGTVGNDTRALRVNDVYTRENNFGNGILTTIPSTKNNAALEPEETREYEFGLSAAFLNNRVNIDVSYYDRETTNQLLSIGTSAATGYSSTFINAGTISNKGVELVLGGDVVRTSDFRYNLSVNFTKNKSEVVELIGETQNYVFADFQGGITANATVGQPLGVFRGTGFEYLDGQRVVNSSGFYKALPDQIIGDPNPDWNMGINNALTYKGISLGFLIDIQHGGDVFSLDNYYGEGTGIPESTVGNNDKGNPVRSPVADGGGVLLPGVTEDGEVNTIYADASFYGGAFYWGNASRNPAQTHIYDASYVKLRELSISYSLPSKWIENVFNRVELSLVGRNLWIIHKNLPYADPESGLGVGPAQGYLTGSYPTVRTMGFKLEVGF